jgi:hypothetical protein
MHGKGQHRQPVLELEPLPLVRVVGKPVPVFPLRLLRKVVALRAAILTRTAISSSVILE